MNHGFCLKTGKQSKTFIIKAKFMRKQNVTVSCIIISLMITSCQKEITQNDNPPTTSVKKEILGQSIEKQRAYVGENLKIIMDEVGALVVKEPGFKTLIETEVAKKFDGEYNVLIKKLIDDPVYGARLKTEKMLRALDAFMNLGDENLYPQIYIPFFTKHQQNNLSRYDTYVEYAYYDGNEIITSVPTYYYDEWGNASLTGMMADEQYASYNQVFVISINETVNPDGEIPPIVNSPQGTQALVNFRIQDLTVKENKESWLAGATEVHIKSNGATYNHRLNGNPSATVVSYSNYHYTGDALKGHLITQIARQEVGYPILNINYTMDVNWKVDNFYSDPIVYTYVIFEYDHWPAAMKILASEIPSAPAPQNFDLLQFRSSNTPYGGVPGNAYLNYAIYGNIAGLPNLTQLYYDGHHINTENIDFTTVKY